MARMRPRGPVGCLGRGAVSVLAAGTRSRPSMTVTGSAVAMTIVREPSFARCRSQDRPEDGLARHEARSRRWPRRAPATPVASDFAPRHTNACRGELDGAPRRVSARGGGADRLLPTVPRDGSARRPLPPRGPGVWSAKHPPVEPPGGRPLRCPSARRPVQGPCALASARPAAARSGPSLPHDRIQTKFVARRPLDRRLARGLRFALEQSCVHGIQPPTPACRLAL
jgi:hypothetical protein